VEGLEDWPYSNYLEWVGLRNGTLIDRRFVREAYSDAASYRTFVLEYLHMRHPPEELAYLEGF
jgi:hypothetical protein